MDVQIWINSDYYVLEPDVVPYRLFFPLRFSFIYLFIHYSEQGRKWLGAYRTELRAQGQEQSKWAANTSQETNKNINVTVIIDMK